MRGDSLLIGDCAQLGPDYLPGHGHADTLGSNLALVDEEFVLTLEHLDTVWIVAVFLNEVLLRIIL